MTTITLERVGRSMADYHCYILRPDRSISSRHDIEAAEAMLKASQIAALSEEVPTIEFWEWRPARWSTRAVEKIQSRADLIAGCGQENGE